MARTRQNYLDPVAFAESLQICKAIGQPTIEVCTYLRLLIKHFLSGARFSGYDPHTLEDLSSACLLKCLKNVKNYRPERGSSFSYFSLVCECAAKDLLRSHYRQVNIKRDLREMGDTAQWHGDMGEIGS